VSSSRTLQTCDPTATGATVRHAEGTSPSSPSVSRPLYSELYIVNINGTDFLFFGGHHGSPSVFLASWKVCKRP
jgi:hypothetical protein